MVGEEQWLCISLQQEELVERGTALGMHGLPPEMHSRLSKDRLNSSFHRCLSHRQHGQCDTTCAAEVIWGLLDGQANSKCLRTGRLRFFNWEGHPKASLGI